MRELQMELPPDVTPCSELPDALYWLMQVEQWGLPCKGGLIDQPHHFMMDIEMAKLGRDRAHAIMRVNARNAERRPNG